MNNRQPYRIIISGGGTGGHVFPAIAIANTLRERHPDAEILFVGAKGRMEMTRVKEAGYKIIGLWISGLQRRLTLSNLSLPFKLVVSFLQARQVMKKFRPDVVVGTGGYASGPIMFAAGRFKVPVVIQEQNSYAGLTNRRVSKRASKICVAYSGMDQYFEREKIVVTGNPVRKDILDIDSKRSKALDHFAFTDSRKTLLIIGGSLGARTINESILGDLEKLMDAQVQVIWQTGRMYHESIKAQIADKDTRTLRLYDFLKQMDLAYAASDVVVSRAGALSISELCVAGRPAILVPSPNVAEDHQTKNAMALVKEDAALLITDGDARKQLVTEAMKLLHDEQRSERLKENIGRLAKPDAAIEIVEEIEKLVRGAE